MFFLVKSRNSQIFYIINILTFSKFAHFYLLVASLYLIRSKLKISFIYSFHAGSHVLMNDFKLNSSLYFITKSCIIEFNFSFGDSSRMLKSCWIHSKNNNFLSYCSAWWNELWNEPCKIVQNPELAICRCFAR